MTVASFLLAGTTASANLFSMNAADNGNMTFAGDKEHKCGAGQCGSKDDKKDEKKEGEASCGEGTCGSKDEKKDADK